MQLVNDEHVNGLVRELSVY